MRILKAVVGVLLATLLLTGCEFSVYKMPLPGGADTGENPLSVTVRFPDVLDLVPQSTVKVNDVTVGMVTDIELDGYVAEVTLEIRNDLELPDNTQAEIRQTSLLGEKFVSLSAPEDPSANPLGDGDTIEVAATNRNPEVEEVLGAMSLLLNGGGVAQLKTITSELNNALEGREDSAKSVFNQIRVFMKALDENKTDIVETIESLNNLAITANRQRDDIESALDNLPAALKSLDRQRDDLVRMLEALSELGNVGTEVIRASKTATIDTIERLQPVLTQLAAADDEFVEAFHVFLTYPFVDEVVGRDPNVARNLHMGDYTNLSVQIDVELGGDDGGGGPPPIPTEECIRLGELPDDGPLPDLSQLCEGALDAVDDCLQDPSEDSCGGLPGALVDEICEDTAIPGICANGGGDGGGDGDDGDGGVLPGLPDLGLGAALPGLNRPGFDQPGAGRTATLADLMDDYDPVLVGLLLPGVAR